MMLGGNTKDKALLDNVECLSDDSQRMKEWRDDCVTARVRRVRWWERMICDSFG